jgi:hypothetical protein
LIKNSASINPGHSHNFLSALDGNPAQAVYVDNSGNVGIGTTSPTAVLHLKAGTATANTAPLKFTSGTLLTTPEEGAVEFLTDIWYGTRTTATARVPFTMGSGTVNEIPYWVDANTLGTLAVDTYPSLTELSYVKGLSSAVQTQIGTKAPSANPTFTGTVILPKTIEIQDTSADHQYVLAVNELTADRTVTLPLLTGNDEFTFNAHTQTLTNKRITKRVASTTDDATAVIDCDAYDEYYLTAIANNTEISVTGTPTNGQTIFIGLKDAGVTKNLTWTGITGLRVTLPDATTAGKQHIIGIKYIASAWRAIAVGVEA